MRRVVVGLALFSLALSALSAAELSNRRAPGFALPDVDLKYHDLADYRGKVVLVNVMKTTCPHCTTFSKSLNAAQEKYGSRIKVLSVVNHQDTQGMVKDYLRNNGLKTTFLFDCGQMTASYLKLSPSNPSFQTPHVFVIDEKGWIQEDHGYNLLNKGLFEGSEINRVIEKYLGPTTPAD